jgi:hypothetical protein
MGEPLVFLAPLARKKGAGQDEKTGAQECHQALGGPLLGEGQASTPHTPPSNGSDPREMGGYGGLCASAAGPHHGHKRSCLGSVDAARVAVPTRLKQAEKMMTNDDK